MPVDNLGFVSSYVGSIGVGELWRSAQPDEVGLQALAKMGINYIARLNEETSITPGREHVIFCLASGGGVVEHMPLHPHVVVPAWPVRVAREIRKQMEMGRKCLVHCTHGRDRTGLIVGLYRLLYDGWKLPDVLKERQQYGVNSLLDIPDSEITELFERVTGGKIPGEYPGLPIQSWVEAGGNLEMRSTL